MEASAYVCLISESPSFISLISFPLKLPPDSHVHSQVASHCCSCRVKTRLPRVCSTISLGIENWSQNFCTSQSLKDRRTVASQWVGNGGRVLLKMWVHTHTQAECPYLIWKDRPEPETGLNPRPLALFSYFSYHSSPFDRFYVLLVYLLIVCLPLSRMETFMSRGKFDLNYLCFCFPSI